MIYYCSHTEPCYGSGNLSVSWSLLFMWRGVEHSPPPPAMPVWTKSEQTGVGPCYEISQSSDSIICLKNINVKWQFYRPIFSSYPFYNCGSQQCQVPGGVRDQRKNLSHKSNDFLTIFERGAYVTKKTTKRDNLKPPTTSYMQKQE